MADEMESSPVIWITGASSGIGAAAARLFAKQGYAVVLSARRKERLDAFAAEIMSEGGQALAISTDVTRIGDLQVCMEMIAARFNRLDVLLNNAGFGRLKWIDMLDPQGDIETQIRVNLLGAIFSARVAAPFMIERCRGHIINIASLAGLIGMPTYSVYAATKFGLRGFNEALRRELHPWGIQVSIVYPGGVETEFSQHTGVQRKTGYKTPEKFRLSAEDVAGVVLRLTKHPRRQVILPGYMVGILWMNALFPSVVDWLVENRFVRKEREIKTSTIHEET
ncbi:MAG: SDR family NAD(P)-dependent oxidoreductase [Anaerolineales bacterium]|nr:SDR family NAD(P)-dependent oxidoreductase [Anaerolineales bacterium]